MTRIKYCGLRRVEDLALAEELGVDYAGLVVVPASRRYVTPEQGRALNGWIGDHQANIQSVLVMMDLTRDEVLDVVEATGVRHVQLAGDESPALCRELREAHGLMVWKSWHVLSADESADALRPALSAYVDAVDGILLDTALRGQKGGTGAAFDWRYIAAAQRTAVGLPIIVAGGLTPENVAELVREHRPYAVDVSSGIETEGLKDQQKMRAFVARVREVRDESGSGGTLR